MKLGKKVGSMYALILLVMFIGFIVIQRTVRMTVEELSVNESENVVHTIKADIYDVLANVKHDITVLSQVIVEDGPEKAINLGSSLVEGKNLYSLVFFGTEDEGEFISYPKADLGSDYDPRQRGWYKEAIKNKDTVISNPYMGKAEKAYVFSVAKEVKDKNGNRLGVIAISINLEGLSRKINSFKIGEEGYAMIFDKTQKSILSYPDVNYISKSYLELSEDFAFFDNLKSNQGTFDYTYDRDRKFLYYETIDEFDWILTGGTTYKEFEVRYAKIKNIVYIIGFLSFLTLGGSLLFLQKKLINNIKIISKSFKELAKGRFDIRLDVQNSKDEIEEMQVEFNNFTEEISKMLKTISTRMRVTVEENEKIIEELSESINGGEEKGIIQLKSAIEETMDNVRNQTASTEESLAGVEEVSASADSMLYNVNETLEVSRMSRRKVEESIRSIVTMSESINKVSKNVISADTQIMELIKLSENIGGISLAITNLAEQTNLLALNAAIESARAGEAGRGFAVVAQEIKKLAERTNTETNKIDELIINIHNEIGKVRDANNLVMEDVKETLHNRDIVNENIEEIVEATRVSDEKVNEVVTIVNEQKIATEEISRAISNISDMSTEIESKETDNYEIIERITNVLVEKLEKIEELSSELNDLDQDFKKFTL